MAKVLDVLSVIAQTTPPTTLDSTERFVRDNTFAIGAVMLVVAMLVGVGLTYGAVVRHRRQRSMTPTASSAGLTYSRGDTLGCLSVAFPLFLAGDGRTADNVMWPGDGSDARVFDYGYYTEHRDHETNQITKRWKYFSCAMARHDGYWPVIRITRERGLDRVAQKLGLADIELESEEFNKTFVIQCEDAKFATDLLDPQMMDFLQTTQGLVDIETKGRWALLTTTRLDAPEDMVGLLRVAETFVDRVPPVVRDLYESAPDPSAVREGAEGAPPDPRDALLSGGFELSDSVVEAIRDAVSESRETRDGTRPDFDLDGTPITERPEENPWG